MSDDAQEIPVETAQPEEWKIRRAATLVKARQKAAELRNAIRLATETISPPVKGKTKLKKKLSDLNETLSAIPIEEPPRGDPKGLVVVDNKPIDKVVQEETIVKETPSIPKEIPSIPKEKIVKKVDFQEQKSSQGESIKGENLENTFYSRREHGFYYY